MPMRIPRPRLKAISATSSSSFVSIIPSYIGWYRVTLAQRHELNCGSDQLRQNVLVKQYYCDVDIAHLISYNEDLAHKLSTQPAEIIPLVSGNLRGIGDGLAAHHRIV